MGQADRREGFLMPKKVFISYSHRQGDWVWDRLVPCLKAGGAEMLIDRERFEAGKALTGQMDTVAWRPLIKSLDLPGMGIVDLQKGSTASRRGLVGEMLRSLGVATRVPAEPEDLVELDRMLEQRDRSWIALTHFDLAGSRNYNVDLFAALRYHTMESRRLVLLVQSRTGFPALLPGEHPLSEIEIKTVELRGRS